LLRGAAWALSPQVLIAFHKGFQPHLVAGVSVSHGTACVLGMLSCALLGTRRRGRAARALAGAVAGGVTRLGRHALRMRGVPCRDWREHCQRLAAMVHEGRGLSRLARSGSVLRNRRARCS
jgi:hypothetical protein